MKVVVAIKSVAQKHEASSEVEENTFTSSLINCPEGCCRKGAGGVTHSPSHPHLFPS
jgi:hypothetical protein